MSQRSALHLSPRQVGVSELLEVVSLVMQAIWAEMRRSGQPIEASQWATLRLIAPQPCTMSELARLKAVSLPTMSKSVDMLVRRGWVERFIDDADRRQTLVRLTPDGKRILADCRHRIEELLDVRLGGLTADQRTQLAAILVPVRDALRPSTQ